MRQEYKSMIRIDVVRHKTGGSKSTVYNQVGDGLLPGSVAMGPRMAAWPENEIDAVVRARIAGKSEDEIRQLVARLMAARSDAE